MKFLFLSWAAAGLLVLAGCAGHQPHGDGPKVKSRPPDAAGSLAGQFTDQGTALALAGAAVLVEDAQKPHILARTVTGADGGYQVSGLPLGVALRVVSQPVTGAVAYGAEASAPIILDKDSPAPAVNLAFSQVAQTGMVAGAARPHPGRPAWIALVLHRDEGGGSGVKLVIRTVRADADGAFQFASVPPGPYEVHFLTRGGHPGRHRKRRRQRRPPLVNPNVTVTVKALETVHLNWPVQTKAGADAPEEVEDPETDE